MWVAFLAVGFAITDIVRLDDAATGLLWMQWTVLWTMFFVVIALGQEQLTVATGWLTLILSFTTCTVPGFLLLSGEWSRGPVWGILVTIAATGAAVLVVASRTARTAPTAPSARAADPVIAA